MALVTSSKALVPSSDALVTSSLGHRQSSKETGLERCCLACTHLLLHLTFARKNGQTDHQRFAQMISSFLSDFFGVFLFFNSGFEALLLPKEARAKTEEKDGPRDARERGTKLFKRGINKKGFNTCTTHCTSQRDNGNYCFCC